MKLQLKIFAIAFLLAVSTTSVGQTVSFELKTSPNITFDFNTIQEYINGITYMNAVTLNINTTERFDIYVGATTTNVGFWDVTSTYSTGGNPPPISILKLQFRNGSSTSLMSGFFPLQDIASPTYIIGTSAAPDVSISCPNNGTNAPGDYLTSPNCYKFNVDLRIVPGFTYQSGLYTLRIDYVIIQDL
jgi:hypothetical protein